jgi:hypothetical protein
MLFWFLLSGAAPPSGLDPRLAGPWEPVDRLHGLKGRIEFAPDGEILVSQEGPPEPELNFSPRGPEQRPRVFYLVSDGDRLLIQPGAELLVSFEGDEMVLTDAAGTSAGRATRLRRP